MCQMLLSINPEYVESILNGTKLYEYRKFKCRDDVDKIIIYATTHGNRLWEKLRLST